MQMEYEKCLEEDFFRLHLHDIFDFNWCCKKKNNNKNSCINAGPLGSVPNILSNTNNNNNELESSCKTQNHIESQLGAEVSVVTWDQTTDIIAFTD